MDGGSTCRHCGALLPPPDMEGRALCLSCGRSSRIEPPPPPPAPPPRPGAGTTRPDQGPTGPFTPWTPGDADTSATAARAAKTVGGCMSVGCISVVVFTLIGVVGSVLLVRSAVDDVAGVSRSSLYPSGSRLLAIAGMESVPTDGGGTTPVEVVAPVYDVDEDDRLLARLGLDGGDGPTIAWRSEAFPPEVYDAHLATSGDTLFAGVDDEVWAISLSTGEKRWEATLPDVVGHTCADCFTVVDETLLVLTADAQVVAFAAGSSEPRWTRRLLDTSGWFLPTPAGVAVVDEVPEDPSTMQVTIVEVGTGATLSTFRPRCGTGIGATGLRFNDGVHVVPGTADLVTVLSFGTACAVRWSAASGQVVWQAALGSGISYMDRDDVLVSGDRLFLPSSAGVSVVDLATGQASTLAAPPDTRVRPLLRRGDSLLGVTESSRGSARSGLVSWGLADGVTRWQLPMPEEADLIDDRPTGSTALFEGSPRAVVAAAGEELALVVFDGGDRTATFHRIDPVGGTAAEVGTAVLGEGSGTPSVTVHRALPGSVLVTIDSRIVWASADGRTARWPD